MIRKLSTLFLLLLILIGFNSTAIQATDTNDDFDPFEYMSLYYENRDIKIDVSETGLVTVNTVIDAYFNYQMHGIQEFIPQRYEMSFVDPETQFVTEKVYYWKVSNIVNESDYPLSTETVENSAVRLRFGDADRYVSGPVRYAFSYQIQTYDLDYNDLYMFYWNILGTGYDVSTKKVTFEVNLPKPVTHPLYIHTGTYYSTSNEFVDYTFVDNQFLKGESVEVIPAGVGITMQVDLDKDYFDFPDKPDNSFYGLILLGIGAITAAYWFFKYGRDKEIVVTIEHEPPKDLSSAMVGYVYNSRSSHKEVLSLIVEWASKGYLMIEELDSDEMKLTKLSELPEESAKYEKTFFDNLFDDRNEVTTKELENTFYSKVGNAQLSLKNYFHNPKRRLFNKTSNRFKGLSFALAGLLIAIYIGIIVYQRFFYFPFALIAFAVSFVVSLIYAVAQAALFHDFTIQSKGKAVLDIILSLVTTAIFVFLYFVVLYFSSALNLNGLLAIVLFFIIVIATINMGQRTDYARDKLGKILGLRTFIEQAEKERLEMLVHDNPKYFYDVLPYAYVLGVSDVWSKKFENIVIEPPVGYQGTSFSTIYYTNRLNNMMYRTTQSMTSVPAPKGSGSGGFGGGGFSGGGGGGGFSGGGFGGGGGGGW